MIVGDCVRAIPLTYKLSLLSHRNHAIETTRIQLLIFYDPTLRCQDWLRKYCVCAWKTILYCNLVCRWLPTLNCIYIFKCSTFSGLISMAWAQTSLYSSAMCKLFSQIEILSKHLHQSISLCCLIYKLNSHQMISSKTISSCNKA